MAFVLTGPAIWLDCEAWSGRVVSTNPEITARSRTTSVDADDTAPERASTPIVVPAAPMFVIAPLTEARSASESDPFAARAIPATLPFRGATSVSVVRRSTSGPLMTWAPTPTSTCGGG